MLVYQSVTFCGVFFSCLFFFSMGGILGLQPASETSRSLIFWGPSIWHHKKTKRLLSLERIYQIWILGYPDLPGGMLLQLVFFWGGSWSMMTRDDVFPWIFKPHQKPKRWRHENHTMVCRGSFVLFNVYVSHFDRRTTRPWYHHEFHGVHAAQLTVVWGHEIWRHPKQCTKGKSFEILNKFALCFIPPLSHGIHVWYILLLTYIYHRNQSFM